MDGIHEKTRESWIEDISSQLQITRGFATEIYKELEEKDSLDHLPVVRYVFETAVDHFQAWNHFPIDTKDEEEIQAWVELFKMPSLTFPIEQTYLGARLWRAFLFRWKDLLQRRYVQLHTPNLARIGVESRQNMAVNREGLDLDFTEDLYCHEPRRIISESFGKYMRRGSWFTGFTVAKDNHKEPVLYIRQWEPTYALRYNPRTKNFVRAAGHGYQGMTGNRLFFFQDDWFSLIEKLPDFWAFIEDLNWDGYWKYGQRDFVESENRIELLTVARKSGFEQHWTPSFSVEGLNEGGRKVEGYYEDGKWYPGFTEKEYWMEIDSFPTRGEADTYINELRKEHKLTFRVKDNSRFVKEWVTATKDMRQEYSDRALQMSVRATSLIREFGSFFYARAYISKNDIPMLTIAPIYGRSPYNNESISLSPNDTVSFMNLLGEITDSYLRLLNGYSYIGFNKFIS